MGLIQCKRLNLLIPVQRGLALRGLKIGHTLLKLGMVIILNVLGRVVRIKRIVWGIGLWRGWLSARGTEESLGILGRKLLQLLTYLILKRLIALGLILIKWLHLRWIIIDIYLMHLWLILLYILGWLGVISILDTLRGILVALSDYLVISLVIEVIIGLSVNSNFLILVIDAILWLIVLISSLPH